MRLEHIPEKKIKELVQAVVAKHLPGDDYRLFFFGSRVRGDNFEHSDIDLGFEGSQVLPAITKLAIEEELENLPTLYRIEFVDFSTVSPKFKAEALQFSEPIN